LRSSLRYRLCQRDRRASCSPEGAGPEAGDEVIAPSFTFFATAGAIHNAGGKPVFVEIDADSFNVSPDAIAAAVTPRTRAIVVVHLFGQMAAMEKILPIAGSTALP
jgi:dTDP-4-amino-4,6-dideoxygalactose transaminase